MLFFFIIHYYYYYIFLFHYAIFCAYEEKLGVEKVYAYFSLRFFRLSPDSYCAYLLQHFRDGENRKVDALSV